MNEIEEIKQRLDLVDVVNQYVTLKKAGANYKGVCPFHAEKTPSLMVSPQKQIWKCFGCQKGGSVFNFVMEAEHLEFGDALRLLAQKAGVTLQPRTQAEHQTQGRKERLYRINNLAATVFGKLLESQAGSEAREYLAKRGLTQEIIQQFRMGWAANNFSWAQLFAKHQLTAGDLAASGHPEKFYNRVMFPIFDVLGNVIAFTGRTLGDQQPKYLNTPETVLFTKGRVLYGLNLAKGAIKEKNYVVLVEGQMDVVALHQIGAANTVASSGTAITESQLRTLSKYTDNFLLAFDNDEAGRQTTKKVIELLLKNDWQGKVIQFGDHKDAGELLGEQKPKERWAAMVKGAPEMLEWWLAEEVGQLGSPQFMETKKALTKAMLPALALVADAARLDQYVAKLARLIEAKPASLYASLEKVRAAVPISVQLTSPIVDLALTNEEQLLALVLYQPSILQGYWKKFQEVSWQSVGTSQIAKTVETCYNEKTLVKNPIAFTDRVKILLGSPLAEKVDTWSLWLTSSWPTMSPELLGELTSEKINQLTTKTYEQAKEKLALAIRAAQEANDLGQVKDLLIQLSQLTKQGAL